MTFIRPLFSPDLSVPYFSHQKEQDPQIRELQSAARFWRTGTGKTRSDVEDTAYQFCNDKIDQALVIAPTEVHRRTWVANQIPRWLNVPGARIVEYVAPSNASAAETRFLAQALKDVFENLTVLVMYYEAFGSKSGQMYAEAFMERARTKITLDESHRIMTAGSVTSTKIRGLAWRKTKGGLIRHPNYTAGRIQTATPTANALSDLYPQFAFLDKEIIGVATKAEFEGMFVHKVKIPGTHFFRVAGHRNVTYLNKRIAPYVFVAKEPEGMPKQRWLPPHPVPMSDEQWKAYRELKKDYQTQLRNGTWVDAELTIVRLKRLQQIVAGHLPLPDPSNEKKVLQRIPLDCPRVEYTLDVVKGCPQKVILWAQEHYEIERLYRALQEAGVSSLMYYGKIKKGDPRDKVIDQFEEDPTVKVLVANDQIGGTGLTIVGRAAPVLDQVFYSHTWSRITRIQCEGRNKRMDLHAVAGGEAECTYHDMIAFGTTDVRIMQRRNEKDDIAQMVADPREVAKLLDDDLDYQLTDVKVAV